MSEVNISIKCPRCKGEGKYDSLDINKQPIVVDPCEGCNGVGEYVMGTIDTTAIMAELDYIHGKVTAIWNKVK